MILANVRDVAQRTDLPRLHRPDMIASSVSHKRHTKRTPRQICGEDEDWREIPDNARN